MIEISLIKGSAAAAHADLIGRWRIEHFQHYPYLYRGSMEYEEKYLAGFTANPDSILALARSGEEVVGFTTALPMASDYEIIQESADAFRHIGREAADYFYIGEVIVQPDHRHKGLATDMTLMIEAHAREQGYRGCCFLTVVRPADHPLRPEGAIDIDPICERIGYRKTDIRTNFRWPTIQPDGSSPQADNEMVYWIKDFN